MVIVATMLAKPRLRPAILYLQAKPEILPM